MAQIVRRVSGRDGSLTPSGRPRRVTQRFPDTPDGRGQAARFSRSLDDVQVLYDVRFRVNRRIQTKTFRRRKDADAWIAQVSASRLQGVIHDPTRGREAFQAVAERWFTARTAKRPRSVERDRGILLKHVYPSLGSRPIICITRADVQKLVDDWSVSGLAPGTVARQYSCLRAVFSWAMSAELLLRTPCRGVRLPQIPNRRHRKVNASDLARLAHELGSARATMMWTGVATGLRWSEVAGLQAKDFDLVNCRVTVSRQLDRKRQLVEPKSAAGRRTFAIPDWLAGDLRAHFDTRGISESASGDLVFVGVKGGPLNYSSWRRTVWAPACRRAGLPDFGFHDLRRVNGTRLVAAGADPKVAQSRLGHADPRLTLRLYADVTEEADRAAADAIGEWLRPARAAPDQVSRAINAR